MYQRYNTNSAAARSMRIRRAHDMEATALDTMHRSAGRAEPGLLSRSLARVQRRTRASVQPAGLEQAAAVETQPVVAP
jgi:hypothetical protein